MLAFPCNQFGAQEPGTDAEILEFATSRFGVTIPKFSKIEVNGPGAAPLSGWLKSQKPGDIRWNFAKFLVDPVGRVVARWAPTVTPEEIAAQLAGYRASQA